MNASYTYLNVFFFLLLNHKCTNLCGNGLKHCAGCAIPDKTAHYIHFLLGVTLSA